MEMAISQVVIAPVVDLVGKNEVGGNEPQPDVENTAVEMEVAVVTAIPGEGEQPDIVEPVAQSNEEGEAPATPRRRRRTTYRSRKRPASEGKGESANGAEAPQAAAAEE